MTTTTVPCLRCKAPYERKQRGRHTTFCPVCRAGNKLAADRQRAQRVYDAGQRILDLAASLWPELDDAQRWRAAEYFRDLGLVPDRMPPGSTTAAGPDEGRTTSYADLDEELTRRSRAAAEHPWFEEHPHWLFEDGTNSCEANE